MAGDSRLTVLDKTFLDNRDELCLTQAQIVCCDVSSELPQLSSVPALKTDTNFRVNPLGILFIE